MHHHFIDRFARENSVVHRLDARTKLAVAVAFTGYTVLLPKYELAALLPLAVLPFAWVTLGKIPWRFVGKQVLICAPFIVTLAVFNPLFDRSVQYVAILGSVREVPGGYVVAANLLGKYLLGITCLVALASTTRFDDLLLGLRWLHVPAVLVEQLHFLYRYLFELVEQSQELLRARSARAAGRMGLVRRVRSSGGMVGVLFVRSYESAVRVFQAMEARLWEGELRTAKALHFHRTDALALAVFAAYMAICWMGR